MADLTGQMGELRMKVQITRKETGLVEEYDLVGKITAAEAEQLGVIPSPIQEQSNGSDSQHDGA